MGNNARDTREYKALQTAYAFFNKKFFSGELPEVFFLFDYHVKRVGGFFAPEKMIYDKDTEATHVVCLNPDYLYRDVVEVFGTLIHEMCHVAEYHGKEKKPSCTRNYHSKVWQDLMTSCFLIGEVNATRTSGSTIIPEDGKFKAVVEEYLVSYEWLTVKSSDAIKIDPVKVKKAKAKNKVKYTCHSCGSNVWGKPNLAILCKPCGEEYECLESDEEGED